MTSPNGTMVGVEWAPGVVRYLLDGEVWAIFPGRPITCRSRPWMGLQMGAGGEIREVGQAPVCGHRTTAPRSSIDIGWVAVYDVMGSLLGAGQVGLFRHCAGSVRTHRAVAGSSPTRTRSRTAGTSGTMTSATMRGLRGNRRPAGPDQSVAAAQQDHGGGPQADDANL